MKRGIIIMLAVLLAACFWGCGRSVPIDEPGTVTLGLYDFTSTGFEGGTPKVVNSRELDEATSLALCEAVNAIRDWDEYAPDAMMGFVGEFTVEGSTQVFLFTEDGGILCDELCGRLDESGALLINTILRGE